MCDEGLETDLSGVYCSPSQVVVRRSSILISSWLRPIHRLGWTDEDGQGASTRTPNTAVRDGALVFEISLLPYNISILWYSDISFTIIWCCNMAAGTRIRWRYFFITQPKLNRTAIVWICPEEESLMIFRSGLCHIAFFLSYFQVIDLFLDLF